MKIKQLKDSKLSLKNDGALQLFFVGVGSAFSKLHFQTNLLLIKGDNHILVDCGNTCSRALLEVGIPITDIRNFIITHSHADHIGGLEEVLLMNRYVTRKKPTIIISETYQHILWDMSLRGGVAFNEEDAGDMLTFMDMFDIERPRLLSEFSRETLYSDFGGFNIKMMRTKHIPDSSDSWSSSFWSCGLIIDDRILFTSDTRFDHDLIMDYEQICNFEKIFHDCQFFTGGVHSSLDELNSFPVQIKQKMILTHYGDNWQQFEGKIQEMGFGGLAKEKTIYEF